MKSFIVPVSLCPIPDHQLSHAVRPGLTHEGSAIWQGVLRLSTKSLSINRPGSRPIRSTRHGEAWGATAFTRP